LKGIARVRVLEVITGGEAGGAQRHVRDLARGLGARGHEVLVIHGGGDWIDRQPGVRTRRVPWLVRAIDPVRDAAAVARLAQEIRRFKPAVVHAHSSKAGVVARWAARLLGVPAVYTAHGFVFTDPTLSPGSRRLYRWVEAVSGRVARAVIAVSRRDLEAGKALGIRRLVYIPNGVDLPPTGRPKTSRTEPVVGFLGRFTPEKGFEVLVDALASLRDGPKLVVAGAGPLAAAFREQCVRAGIRAVFLGWQDDPAAFLAAVDVLVLPSWKEGLPYTLLDALAAGVPTVVTDVGGMGDAVRPLAPDWVVPPGDAAALARAVRSALNAPSDFAERARAHVAAHYSLAAMVARTAAVLEEAAGWRRA
jgi:glycosyltransferase involved in cell wall biosynthesis